MHITNWDPVAVTYYGFGIFELYRDLLGLFSFYLQAKEFADFVYRFLVWMIVIVCLNICAERIKEVFGLRVSLSMLPAAHDERRASAHERQERAA